MKSARSYVPLLILAAFLPSASGWYAEARKSPSRSNVLLIVVDDMGYSDLGAFGGEIRTPNLDRLARSGVMMTDFYVGPTCSPTRSMLISGNDNHIAGLGNMNEALSPNQVGQPGYEGYLNDRVVSVASLLQRAGYHTYMAGKWHLGIQPEHDPSHRGFEKSYTMLEGGTSHFDDEWMMYANYTPTYRENGIRTHVPKGFYSTEFYTSKIIDYIGGQSDDRPFFAYLSYTAVHDPLHLPDEWIDKYQGAYDDGYDELRKRRLSRMKELGIIPEETQLSPRLAMVPAWNALSADDRKRQVRKMELYAAMVENVDFHVGRLIRYLKEQSLYDDTLILFFSDNGANGAEMHMYPETDEAWIENNSDNRFENWGRQFSRIAQGPGWAQASNTPFRLFKAFIAEGGIRSPLIIAGPGVAKSQIPVRALAHVMDIAPTLLEISETTYPGRFQGREVVPMRGKSLLPLLYGEIGFVRSENEPICWELFGWRAVRLGRWKAAWIASPFGVNDWQLFNLKADPGETRDLANEEPEMLHDLVNAWEMYSQEVGIVMPGQTDWPTQ